MKLPENKDEVKSSYIIGTGLGLIIAGFFLGCGFILAYKVFLFLGWL